MEQPAALGRSAVIQNVERLSPRDQYRCACGNLLAKLVPRGIELKCRRCKRIVLIPFSDIKGWEQRTPSPLVNTQ